MGVGEEKELHHQELSYRTSHAECPASDAPPPQGGFKRKLGTSRMQKQQGPHVGTSAILKVSGPPYTLPNCSPKPFSLHTVFLRKGTGFCRGYLCNIPVTSAIRGNIYWGLCLFSTYLLFKQCFLITVGEPPPPTERQN